MTARAIICGSALICAVAIDARVGSATMPRRAANAQGHQSSGLDASEIPPDALHYTVVFFSKPIGIEGVWKTGAREWRYHYEFNDHGHGPWVNEKVVVDARGLPVAVGPEPDVPIPPGTDIRDAHGQTLLPGLWDMHVHLEGTEGLMSLAVGITTVRDLGNQVDEVVALRDAFDSGARIGPRLLLAGLIDGRGSSQSSLGIAVGSEKEAREAVDRYADLKFDQIKVYSSVRPELVPAIVSRAHARGLRVSGHVPMHLRAQDVVAEGFDELQHVYYLFLSFMPDVMNRDAPTGLVAACGDRAAALDLRSDQVRSLVRLLKERGTVVDPTLNAFESLLTARPGVPEPSLAAVYDRLPIKMKRSALKGGITVPDGKDQTYRDSFQAFKNMTGALYAAGIPLVVGTDFLAGFTYQRELELHVAAGIPVAAVLQYATLGSARVMQRDAELGSIRPGKLADVVLVDGDPVANISDIRRVVTVIKNGTEYSATALQESIGVRAPR